MAESSSAESRTPERSIRPADHNQAHQMRFTRLTATTTGLALRRAYRGIETLFDHWSGIQTSAEADGVELGFTEPDRNGYAPSRWSTLRKILPENEVSSDDVFIDLGSGKGRVLLTAARYPFRRVVGVEISAELNAVARVNVEASRERLTCKNIEIIDSDIVDFAIPDDVTVVFIYNPFSGKVFADAIQKLIESYDRNPRQIRIIYRNPLEEDALLATGRIVPIRYAVEVCLTLDLRRWRSIRMYNIHPAS